MTLSDGSVFCIFRTISGHPYCSYSRDGAKTFSAPEPLRYADGRMVRHPRAANFIWKCTNGKYLYWYHNHGGNGYDDRNPAWLCGAVERSSPEGKKLAFLQPKIVLFDDDPMIRMSYPDLVEEHGEYYITETQKNAARVHKIDRKLIESLWDQPVCRTDGIRITSQMPRLKPFTARDFSQHDMRSKCTGYSFTLRFRYLFGSNSETIFSTMENDRGIRIDWKSRESQLEVFLSDGKYHAYFIDDDALLAEAGSHEIAVVFDGGAHLVYFTTDGRFFDGGDRRQFGFGRFSSRLQSAASASAPLINKTEAMTFFEGIVPY